MHTSRFVYSLIAMLGASVALAGCAGLAPVAGQHESGATPLARLGALPGNSQTRLMTQLMAAEFALAHHDMRRAAHAYASAAQVSTDPRVATRAAKLATGQGLTNMAKEALARMQATGADKLALAREKARLALSLGDRDKAIRQLSVLLAPGGVDAWTDFARVLAGVRDPALAGVVLEKLANVEALPADQPSIWVAMSQLGKNLNRYLYADRVASAAAERFDSAVVYAWAAHLKLVAGYQDAGLDLYAKAVAADPDNARLRLAYAAALAEAGEHRQALDVLKQGPQSLEVMTASAAYAAGLDDTAELARIYAVMQKNRDRYAGALDFFMGKLAEAIGKKQQAVELYARVSPTGRNAFDAMVRQAVLRSQLGQPQRAHQLARTLQQDYVGEHDKLRQAYLLEAQLYLRAQQPDKAVAVYQRGLRALPDDTGLLYGLALTEADNGQIDAAVTHLRRILELEPDNIDAMNALGYTLADQNRHLDEAEQLLEQAMASKPDQPAIMDSWGWLKYRQGQLQQAAASLRKAWEMRPDPEIGMHLGEVLWKLGQQQEAGKIFDQVRAASPDDSKLVRVLERLQQ